MTSQISHVHADLFNTQSHIASNDLRLEQADRSIGLMEKDETFNLEITTVGLGLSQLNINLGSFRNLVDKFNNATSLILNSLKENLSLTQSHVINLGLTLLKTQRDLEMLSAKLKNLSMSLIR
jgi:hypothetical protein